MMGQGLMYAMLFVLVFWLALLFLAWLDRRLKPPVRGYKGFNLITDDRLRCLDMVYKVGAEYTLPVGVQPVICDCGFHFCSKLTHVMNYYSPGNDRAYCEVEAFGNVVTVGDKSCTDGIRIVRRLTVPEIREILERELPRNYFLQFFAQVPSKWTDGKPQVETVRQRRKRVMKKKKPSY